MPLSLNVALVVSQGFKPSIFPISQSSAPFDWSRETFSANQWSWSSLNFWWRRPFTFICDCRNKHRFRKDLQIRCKSTISSPCVMRKLALFPCELQWSNATLLYQQCTGTEGASYFASIQKTVLKLSDEIKTTANKTPWKIRAVVVFGTISLFYR